MIISTLSELTYEGSTGISEKYPVYKYTNVSTPAPEYKKGDILACGDGVFERIGDDLQLKEVNGAPSALTKDEVYLDTSDSTIKYVTETDGDEAAKQPENYANVDTDLHASTWKNRYLKLGTLDGNNRWTGTVADIKHTIYEKDGKWRHRVEKIGNNVRYWVRVGDMEHAKFEHIANAPKGTGEMRVKINDTIVASTTFSNTNPPIPHVTTISNATDTYLAGDYKYTLFQNYRIYEVWVAKYRSSTILIKDDVIDMKSESDINVHERTVYCVQANHCGSAWITRTVINRNGTLYARTGINVPMETFISTVAVGTALDCLDKIDWGWKWKEPSQRLIPFDGKSYTTLIQHNEISFDIGVENITSLAITNLIANDVKVEFVGSPEGIGVAIDNTLSVDEITPLQGITKILYAKDMYTGTVRLTFKPADGIVQIGEILVGNKIDAGFTNLKFTNKYNDYSPYEKDQWGNITRVEGIKTNVLNGTVDVELTQYDRINRLMKYVGGRKIMLDGCDNLDNEVNDDGDFFASTQLVGRVGNFALSTRLESGALSQMATYSFNMEEDV